jgi:1,4-dihydroxy-2-naphthoate octaprenyltransferase
MTIFSWLIIFTLAIKDNGNILYGLLSLIGIILCHLATNLFDDYNDFKTLKKERFENKISLINTQRGKCAYLLNNTVTTKDVLKTLAIYLTFASIIGLFFIISRGIETLIFIILASIIILTYSKLSNIRLSELAVGLAYGVILFEGVYFVMTGNLSLKPLLYSIPSSIFTINLIFTDTLMDYEIDKNEGKKTFIGLFQKKDAIIFQIIMLLFGYTSFIFINTTILSLLPLLTIPLSIDLIKSNLLYIKNPEILPVKHWYHFPFEEWNDIKKNRSLGFMFRMYQARNLMIYTSILIIFSILLK